VRLARGNAACARPIGHSRCPLSTTPPPPPLPFLAEPNELHRHLTDRQTSLQASTPSPSLAPHQSPNQAFSGLPSSLHRPSIEPPSQAFIGLPSTKPSLHRPSISNYQAKPSSAFHRPSQAFIGLLSNYQAKPSSAFHRPSQAFIGLLSRTTKPSLHRPSIDQAKPSSAFYRTTKPSLHRPSIESPNQAFSGLPSSLQRPSIEQPSQAFIGTPSSHCRHPNASSVLIPLHVSVNT